MSRLLSTTLGDSLPGQQREYLRCTCLEFSDANAFFSVDEWKADEHLEVIRWNVIFPMREFPVLVV